MRFSATSRSCGSRSTGARPAGDRGDFTSVVTRALWTAALITYARCFGKGGRRTKLTEDDILRTPNGHRSLHFHRDTTKIRGKHIAHSVNGMETYESARAAGVDVVKTWPEVVYQRGAVDPGVPRS